MRTIFLQQIGSGFWASPLGDSTFRLDNAPFFAKGISVGDIVSAKQSEGRLVFEAVLQPSGHCTVRVVVFRGDLTDEQLQSRVADLRKALKDLGCSTELSHIPNLFSVDIPPELDYSAVSEFLSQEEANGSIEYEEACLA